ncbi:hypothetical protein Goshw_020982 [Gossypium schwendimanii]|uniref:Uncharacterized protein n=1 Tax=Gossypium schwendimanii TaxID=34291 RepID=A0A7J9MCW7_GOSSC|nr:hypothetical protein [Gossypium schwendimanii]
MQTTKCSLLHRLWLKWSALIHGPGFSVFYQLIWAWKMGMGTQLSVTNKWALRLQFLTYYQGWSIRIVRGTCLQIDQGGS